MALTFFEVYGINGAVLKFAVDETNGIYTLATTGSGGTSGNVTVINGGNILNVDANGSIPIRNSTSNLNVVFPTAQQINVANEPTFKNSFFENSVTGVTVGTSLTTLMTIDVRNFNFISFEITNGTTAFAQCQIQARYNSSSTVWNPKTFGATEYTTGTGKQSGNTRIAIIEASGDLNVLGASTSGWVEIDCSRYESMRIQARVASGSSSVTCRCIAK